MNSERPYVVQLFGNNPEHFALAARFISSEIKPDGIDINFGCPIAKVFKRGAGAALMTNLASGQRDNPKRHRQYSSACVNKDQDQRQGSRSSQLPRLRRRPGHQGHNDPRQIVCAGFLRTKRYRDDSKRTRPLQRGNPCKRRCKNASQGMELLAETSADGIGIARGALEIHGFSSG